MLTNHIIYIVLTFIIGLLTGWSSVGFYKKAKKTLKLLRVNKNNPELENL